MKKTMQKPCWATLLSETIITKPPGAGWETLNEIMQNTGCTRLNKARMRYHLNRLHRNGKIEIWKKDGSTSALCWYRIK